MKQSLDTTVNNSWPRPLAKNQKTRKSGVAERHAIRGSALVSNLGPGAPKIGRAFPPDPRLRRRQRVRTLWMDGWMDG